MRASLILRHLCAAAFRVVHQARHSLMLAAVDALLRGGRLSLTALGRSLSGTAQPKHRIKRIDRFLGNAHAQSELVTWYAALARRLLGKNLRPVVLLDWTQTHGAFNALVAAVAFEGRAIPIYAEVHSNHKLGNRQVLRAFMASLAKVVGLGVKPILVADAGFKTPFFSAVRERGWDFVVRLRGRGVLKQWSRTWGIRDKRLHFSTAFAMANERAQHLGRWLPHAAGDLTHEYPIVLAARPATRRRRAVGHYRRRALEPWLLATSLQGEPAEKIVGVYKLRMQIEESFRDTKNARLGWALEYARSRDIGRQNLLLLVAALALAAALLAGAAVERAGEAKRFQANTIRTRRVQSLFRLGVFVLGSGEVVAVVVRQVLSERGRVVGFRKSWIQLSLRLTRRRNGKWY